MLILFWNIQRPGVGGFDRFENVLGYVAQLLTVLKPDLLLLCEVPPQAFAPLGSLARSEYGALPYLHKSVDKTELLDEKSGIHAFSESVCSFFAFYRRKTFGELVVEVTDDDRFFYHGGKVAVQTPQGVVKEVEIQKEARPLVRLVGKNVCFGLCHLVSGAPTIALKQLEKYLTRLASCKGALLIGDMNIDFETLPKTALGPYKACSPGYLTHGASTTLDYLWAHTALWQGVRPVTMAEDLLENYFQEREGRLADHAIIGFQLFQPMFETPEPVAFPWLPPTMKTRSRRRDGEKKDDKKGSGDGEKKDEKKGSGKMIDLTMDAFVYAPSPQQRATLTAANLAEIRVDPNGDCLFNALIAMNIKGLDDKTPESAMGFRLHLANTIAQQGGPGSLEPVLAALDMNLVQLANAIMTQDYAGLLGDVMPEIIARVLRVRIRIIGGDGNDAANINGGDRGTFVLIRFRPMGAPEHYHGTRSTV